MTRITVVVAAEPRDRALCRSLLPPAAGIAVVADVDVGEAALAAVARLRPQMLLLDLQRPRLDALAALPRIRLQSPRTRVILLTSRRIPAALILEGLRRGARGYLDRAAFRPFLLKAVRAVDAGEAWVPRQMVSRILDQLVRLSAAEREAGRVAGVTLLPRPRRGRERT
jgi:DNA-binding NarL/FixJ family response regulator